MISAAVVFNVQLVAQLEQLFEPARPIGQRPLLLQRDLRAAELPLELLVLRLGVAQADVAAPDAADAREPGRQAALHLGENAEGDRLEHRHADFANSPGPRSAGRAPA